MTSAKSCKSPERTWLMEMLRRCKALPVLIAVAYFLANILPILLSYSSLERVIAYVYSTLTGSNILNLGIGIVGGIVVSCAVFRYLHSNDSVIDAHSRPLTRTQLFRGSFFAGLIMVIAPVILTGLFYMCVTGAHGAPDMMDMIKEWGLEFDGDHVLCASNIIGWVLDSVIIIGFTYCVSCFAAVLAGTAVVQALLSFVLIALTSIVYGFFLGYMSAFLHGFMGGAEILKYLSPYAYILVRADYPFASAPVTLMVYAIVSVLITFAAVAIYRKVKLEKVEKTIVVPFVAEFLVILLTAAAVSMVLFIARSFLSINTTAGTIITIILATVIFFPIFCMIADQSFRIFKDQNVRVFIIYAAVMCVMLAFTVFDVTGFEKRVPEASQVESVSIIDSKLQNTEIKGITDEDAIARITALHNNIAKAGDQSGDSSMSPAETSKNGMAESISGLEVVYKLKNGRKLARSYGEIYPDSYDAYADFYECETIRKNECIDAEHPLRAGQYMSVTDAHVDKEGNLIDDTTYLVPDENVKGITAAANEDILKWTARDRGLFDAEYDPANDKSAYSLEINVDYRLPKAKRTKLENYVCYYMFNEDDEHITKYFEEHPEIIAEKNIIQPEDPILGNDDSY